MATASQRHHVGAVLDFFHQHASRLLYPPHDVRTAFDNECWHWSEHTTETMLREGHFWQGDCSEFGSYVLKCAGLWKWTQPGYTGSHLASLPVYTDGRRALTGALVVFGPGTGHHEAIVYERDPVHGDPLCASHGRPGFDLLRVSQIAETQPAGVRYLSIAHL